MILFSKISSEERKVELIILVSACCINIGDSYKASLIYFFLFVHIPIPCRQSFTQTYVKCISFNVIFVKYALFICIYFLMNIHGNDHISFSFFHLASHF